MPAPKHNLHILPAQAPVTRSLVTRDSDGQIRIVWTWEMSHTQRLTVDAAKATERPDYLHIDILDLVLEERTIRANKGVL